jgi:transposase
MPKLEIDPSYINKTLAKLTNNPTAQDMDWLVEAYATFGYMEATATGDADLAEAERKYAESEVIQETKVADPKTPQAQLEAIAAIKTKDYRLAEIRARTNARKISNTWRSIEQAINAIKFRGRFDSFDSGVRMNGNS